jgi:hypothetical protein
VAADAVSENISAFTVIYSVILQRCSFSAFVNSFDGDTLDVFSRHLKECAVFMLKVTDIKHGTHLCILAMGS